MMLAAGPIVWAMTGGFPDGGPEKFALAQHLSIITFPYLALISLVSLLGGILNSLNRFWVNAAAPILLNICMIIALIFFRGDTPIETAANQAIAVTVSGALQLLWLMWACHKACVNLKLTLPRLTPDVKLMLALIAPAAIGQRGHPVQPADLHLTCGKISTRRVGILALLCRPPEPVTTWPDRHCYWHSYFASAVPTDCRRG